MKKLTALAFLFLMAAATFAQVAHGVVKEGLTLDSKILVMKVRYTIYLPFDYETSSRV
jgi:hypothetical protein